MLPKNSQTTQKNQDTQSRATLETVEVAKYQSTNNVDCGLYGDVLGFSLTCRKQA